MKAIDQVEKAYDALKGARKAKLKVARLKVENEMTQLTLEFEALVLKARNEGASVTRIATEMGASRTTVYQMIERGEKVAPATETLVDPLNSRYTLIDGGVRVSLTVGDLTEHAAKLGWADGDLARVPGLTTGDFDVQTTAGGAQVLMPAVDFMQEHGKRHPVAEWAYSAENEAEALGWYAAHQTEAVAA